MIRAVRSTTTHAISTALIMLVHAVPYHRMHFTSTRLRLEGRRVLKVRRAVQAVAHDGGLRAFAVIDLAAGTV